MEDIKGIIKLIGKFCAVAFVMVTSYFAIVFIMIFSAFNYGHLKDVIINDSMYQLYDDRGYYIIYCPGVCVFDNDSLFIESERKISNIYSENGDTLVIVVPNNKASDGEIQPLNIFDMPIEKIEKLPKSTRYYYGLTAFYNINIIVEYKD